MELIELEAVPTADLGSASAPSVMQPLLVALNGSRDDGSSNASGGAAELAAVGLSITRDRDAAGALAVLDKLEQAPGASEVSPVAAEAQMWRGAALLLLGVDGEALVALRQAVGSMRRAADPNLPRALVFLSEAEWRAGNEDGADRAADLALRMSSQKGSRRVILRGLEVFPDVVARCIDAEAPSREISSWRGLGRALLKASSRLSAGGARAHLVEFGRSGLVIDGRFVRPRITKSIELLAFLVSRPGGGATREQLLDAFWGGSAETSACSYLRQAIRKLRDVLPPEIAIERNGDRVVINGAATSSDSTSLDSALDRAASSVGAEKEALLTQALLLADYGEYLAGCNTPWVDERREHLVQRTREARLDLGEVQFELRRHRQAWTTVGTALREDPLSERAWRLRMRVAQALGDDDGIVTSYVGCREALAVIGLEPSRATTDLVRVLRA